MKGLNKVIGVAMLFVAVFAGKAFAQQRDYPIQPVPFTQVHVNDNFWQPKMEVNANITIPYVLAQCKANGRVDNFLRAAKLLSGDQLKIKNPVFTTTTFTYNLTTAVKFIQLLSASNNVEVIGNFDVVTQNASISFPSTGNWYDNFTGNTVNVTSIPYTMTLAPGEYHLFSKTPLTY